MQSQRISAAMQASYYYGDDCPAWAFSFDNQRAIDKSFNTHWHPDLEIYYVEDGDYEFYIGRTSISLHSGDMCVVSPGTEHSIRSTSPKAKFYSIGIAMRLLSLDEGHFFQKSFLEPLGQGLLEFDPVVHPTDRDYNSFYMPVERIVRSWKQRDKVIMYGSAVSICCTLLQRSAPKTEKPAGFSKEHDAIQQCIVYMQKNYMHKITLEQLAELSNLHPNYLCTLFHKYTGASPMSYLSGMRMQRARRLLRETDLSVRQVAEKTGFNSASFFSKRFKAVMGIPPVEYGNAYRKNKAVK